MMTNGGPPGPDSSMTELVEAACAGEERAWDEIVRRHTGLVLARARQFRLTPPQTEDVAQTVWLNLLEHLHQLRDPEALPGWIATTVRRECLRMTNSSRRALPVDPQTGALDGAVTDDLDAQLDADARFQALRDGLAELPEHQRRLLLLLSEDPPLSYQTISERLGIPVGSIGPTRARGLARLRQSSAIRSYLTSPTGGVVDEGGNHVVALG
jgi:RNA polymerase sigma factor (sigma-70 family)